MFNPKRDKFPNKSYLEDGNPEMYTRENMDKREALQDNAIVRNAIQTFIEAQQLVRGNPPVCTKEDYLRVFSRCAGVLRQDINHEEIINQLREEFDQDCQEKKKKKKKKEQDDETPQH